MNYAYAATAPMQLTTDVALDGGDRPVVLDDRAM